MMTVTNTVGKSKQIRTQRKGSVVVKKSIAHFRKVKLLVLLKSCHCEIQNRFWCLNQRKRGEFAPEFQMLCKFSLVFINTTASSKVVNHASTENVFRCTNLQIEFPQNFISQIDRRSVTLCVEYHVPGKDFRRRKMAKLMVAITLI